MKQIKISFLLTALLSMVGARAFAHDIEVANTDGVTIYYNYINDGKELAVTYRGRFYNNYSEEYSGNVAIPISVTYNGNIYSVTSIGSKAFIECSGLTSVTIPNSVTSIGGGAFFGCSGLTSVTIGNSVTSIGSEAFRYCSGLTSVTIPNSVTSIGNYAFSGCSGLTSVTIGNSVTSIADEAFYGCSGLKSVTIPSSVTSIGSTAFCGCSGLTNISVASGNAKYDSRNNCNAIIETASNTLIAGCKNTIIPNSVTTIGDFAFAACSSLANVTIPNSVTTIGQGAFHSCSGLTSVTIPNSVTTIDVSAFLDCTGLTSVTIGNSVTSIGNYAFWGCSGLTSIVIPNSVQTIGDDAFSGCTNLQYILYLNDLTGQYGSNATIYHVKDLTRWVQWTHTTFDYSGKSPITTFTYDDMPAGFVPTATMPELKKNVGTYTENILFTFTNDDVSFQTEVPFTYTIKPAKLTAKVNDASRLYGDGNPQFSSVYSGFVNNEDESVLTNPGRFITTATVTSEVGTYAIKQSGATAQNYVIDYEDGVLTVTKAPLTANVNSYTRKYGEQNPKFEINYSGLKNNETAPAWTVEPTVSTIATPKSDVGVYEITATGGEAKNYELSSISAGLLTVTSVPLLVKANSFSRLYFEENPELSYIYSGFVNDDGESSLSAKPTLRTNATKQSSVGVYPIEIGGADAKNYTFSYENGTLTVNKRQLTVSAMSYTRAYGEENPAFEVSYTGFVNNENEGVLISKPKASTVATPTTDVGVYDITIGNGVAENYDFNYVSGKLTIEKAYQTLSWDQDFSEVKKYDQVELLATASSGLEVTYTVEGNPICSVLKIGNKQYLDCSGEGETVIVAVQLGNKNYWQTTKIYKPITIQGPTGIRSATLNLDGDAQIFDLSGNRINNLQKGVNIVRMSDGTVKKVIVK